MYINKVGKINLLITNIIYIVLIDFLYLNKDNDDLQTEATNENEMYTINNNKLNCE